MRSEEQQYKMLFLLKLNPNLPSSAPAAQFFGYFTRRGAEAQRRRGEERGKSCFMINYRHIASINDNLANNNLFSLSLPLPSACSAPLREEFPKMLN
jgi:hypothetical protein